MTPDGMPAGDGPGEQASRRARGGWRDFWQLHVPLVLVLALCTFITVIEVRRASEGVWRAWAYMFEWPLIGLFTIWIWHRYRTEGSITKGFAERWRERIRRLDAEADAQPAATSQAPPGPNPAPPADDGDPQLDAWRAYVDDLKRREPPGSPPPAR